ncbi:transcriptional regulator [Rhizobacter sp. AJA081-3]|nr:transcriptional regulator [Rhizobacter sp. AJA081-3]
MASAVDERVETGVEIRLLGPLSLWRGGAAIALPPSRKLRALLAHLALAPRPLSRDALCEFLWDLPSDPRAELRGSLSKLRGLLDEPGRARVQAEGDAIRLDLSDVSVDVLELDRAAHAGLASLDAAALRAMAARFTDEFLQGLEIARSAPYSAWLVGQRRRLRALHVAVLEHLAAALPPAGDEALACLALWLQLAPFDRRAHERLFDALAARGELRAGDEHLAAASRLFEAEGQDAGPLAHAWRSARQGHASPRPARPASATEPAAVTAGPPRRASIAVMPFADASGPLAAAGLGSALAHDVTMRLAKLRNMFVISQGSTAALDSRGLGAEEAARALDVDYVASGSLRRRGEQLSLEVQLTETRSARILWADVLEAPRRDALAVLDELGNHLVAAIAGQVEMSERNRAVLKPPSQLDAWEAHHRGLWHMYRFHREDNQQARHFFETAIRLDPTFARPYAGLSFTHFQNAFLGWGERGHETEQAYRSAAQGVLADDQDPAARWALGRAHWLRGRIPESIGELDMSVALSPNFSQGHYTLAFVNAQSGDAQAAIVSSDHARELSPFDPLLFAMLASRALALMRLGRHGEAADWAMKAAARPNAHVHILGIASHCLALAGRHDEAQRVMATIRASLPGYGLDDFLGAFRFDAEGTALIRRVAPQLGLA